MKKITTLLIVFLLVATSFAAGVYYYQIKNVRFGEAQPGATLAKNRDKWGTPDHTHESRDEIVDSYSFAGGLNKCVFIFGKKDSLLVRKWKEY